MQQRKKYLNNELNMYALCRWVEQLINHHEQATTPPRHASEVRVDYDGIFSFHFNSIFFRISFNYIELETDFHCKYPTINSHHTVPFLSTCVCLTHPYSLSLVLRGSCAVVRTLRPVTNY